MSDGRRGSSKIHIVGMGDDGYGGLTGLARDRIQQAGRLLGSQLLLKQIPASDSERIVVSPGLDDLHESIESLPDDGQDSVLLASGDPLFYGITRYLIESLGKDRFEVVPHVSTMQLAFARVKESWDDAYLTSLATESLDRVVDHVRTAERVGLFTTDQASPSVVASALLDRRIDYFTAYVCENLGTPAETVTQASLTDIVGKTFSPLNVMVLVRRHGAADQPAAVQQPRVFGNPDEVYLQSRPKRGLMTPQEVRCIALAELAIQPTSIVWDVGAGSGSLAIEAANLASKGQVHAIEMDAEDYALMLQNAETMGAKSLIPVHAQAPAAFDDLPDPDAVFVGGSGRFVPDLTAAAAKRLKPRGRIVINVNSIDNLTSVQQVLDDQGLVCDVRMINIARGCYQLQRVRFESLNPTFLVFAHRDG
ncbi:precorrin-6Y C5,15-methyltransferase (decarboxylating) [Neorhodopirellula lusitana]|uniref:Precorrin-6Y C5,15-methyltransferase (Decarboxylating) n=1 Tax=Neorhodopirellula lusitana TaxID=445327 RepID=A0ABY1QAL3_9BACT|nr:precorrin-6y C5,15-methyltransferase (decarboxylating) subunit CbiE [Neorhodopirellula lusitana]SMP61160.1 precorrin-6Y C5,15-methyltransferase (decarboxylating) [Neorhodopirellula lusitana]